MMEHIEDHSDRLLQKPAILSQARKTRRSPCKYTHEFPSSSSSSSRSPCSRVLSAISVGYASSTDSLHNALSTRYQLRIQCLPARYFFLSSLDDGSLSNFVFHRDPRSPHTPGSLYLWVVGAERWVARLLRRSTSKDRERKWSRRQGTPRSDRFSRALDTRFKTDVQHHGLTNYENEIRRTKRKT